MLRALAKLSSNGLLQKVEVLIIDIQDGGAEVAQEIIKVTLGVVLFQKTDISRTPIG